MVSWGELTLWTTLYIVYHVQLAMKASFNFCVWNSNQFKAQNVLSNANIFKDVSDAIDSTGCKLWNFWFILMDFLFCKYWGGSRLRTQRAPPKGPGSFVLTNHFYETATSGVGIPHFGKSWICHWYLLLHLAIYFIYIILFELMFNLKLHLCFSLQRIKFIRST